MLFCCFKKASKNRKPVLLNWDSIQKIYTQKPPIVKMRSPILNVSNRDLEGFKPIHVNGNTANSKDEFNDISHLKNKV